MKSVSLSSVVKMVHKPHRGKGRKSVIVFIITIFVVRACWREKVATNLIVLLRFVITQTKKLYLTVTPLVYLLTLDYVQTEEAWVSHKNIRD